MRYLVSGGAGYIGSHIVLALCDAGHDVEVIDNLCLGHRRAIPSNVTLHEIDLIDAPAVESVIAQRSWDGVFHLAALSLTGESFLEPLLYIERNFLTSLHLIKACIKHGVGKFVFSSTAALFGGPSRPEPITETSHILPGSPYGESKFLVERLLHWADSAHGLRSASLRYFNAAGADPKGRAGEDHLHETHLLPLTIGAALGRRPPLQIFGDDYETRDGTCIRDYVHVSDIADAHLRVLDLLQTGSVAYNLGNGKGYSNLEVIESVERVSGRRVPWQRAPKRAGDPPILIADSSSFVRDSGWKPRFSNIDAIVETAFSWHMANPSGYRSQR